MSFIVAYYKLLQKMFKKNLISAPAQAPGPNNFDPCYGPSINEAAQLHGKHALFLPLLSCVEKEWGQWLQRNGLSPGSQGNLTD